MNLFNEQTLYRTEITSPVFNEIVRSRDWGQLLKHYPELSSAFLKTCCFNGHLGHHSFDKFHERPQSPEKNLVKLFMATFQFNQRNDPDYNVLTPHEWVERRDQMRREWERREGIRESYWEIHPGVTYDMCEEPLSPLPTAEEELRWKSARAEEILNQALTGIYVKPGSKLIQQEVLFKLLRHPTTRILFSNEDGYDQDIAVYMLHVVGYRASDIIRMHHLVGVKHFYKLYLTGHDRIVKRYRQLLMADLPARLNAEYMTWVRSQHSYAQNVLLAISDGPWTTVGTDVPETA